MSLCFLCNFVRKQTQQNGEIQKAMQELCIEIERYELLQQEHLDTMEKKLQLQIELFFLHSIAEQLQEEHQQYDAMANEISTAHQNSMKLFEQLKRVDLHEIAGYKIFVNDMKRQKEQKEMEDIFKKRQELWRRMEDRNIVKKLRRKQTELTTVSVELEEVEKNKLNTLEKTFKKLEKGQKQRNELILQLVIGAKQLAGLREEIKNVCGYKEKFQKLQTKKAELTQQLRKLQTLSQQPIPAVTSQSMEEIKTFKKPTEPIIKNDARPSNPPTLASYNPLAFIKSLEIKFDIEKAMVNFHEDLEAEKQKHGKVVPSQTDHRLRSILRQPTNNQDKESQSTSKMTIATQDSRRVHFADPSSSSCISSPERSVDTDTNTEDINNLTFNTSEFLNEDSQRQLNRAINKVKSGEYIHNVIHKQDMCNYNVNASELKEDRQRQFNLTVNKVKSGEDDVRNRQDMHNYASNTYGNVESQRQQSCNKSKIMEDVMDREDIQDLTFDDSHNKDTTEEQIDQSDKLAKTEDESIITFTLSSEISPAQPPITQLLKAEEDTKKKNKPTVEILESKIVKPAGTTLPKTLPTSITPSPTMDDDVPYSQTVEVRTTTPINTNPTPKLFKSPLSVLDKKCSVKDTKATIKNALNAFLVQRGQKRLERSSTSDSEDSAIPRNSLGKQNKTLDFDSLYKSNISPESDEEQNNSTTAFNDTNDGLLMDFDANTGQIDTDDTLNFSDSDFQMNGRKFQDFF